MANVGRTQLQRLRKARPCRMRLDLRKNARAEMDRRCVLAERARHRDEDAVDLRLLFVEQAHQLVVLLDRLERLHKDGLSGRRRPMNDAGNLALELGLHGNDEAIAANGDQLVLRTAVVGEVRGGCGAGSPRWRDAVAPWRAECAAARARRRRSGCRRARSCRATGAAAERSRGPAAARRGWRYPASHIV